MDTAVVVGLIAAILRHADTVDPHRHRDDGIGNHEEYAREALALYRTVSLLVHSKGKQ